MSIAVKHLRDLRESRGVKLPELADRSGVSKGLLSQAERGIYALKPHEVRAVEHGLGLEEGTLVFRMMLVVEERVS